MRLLLMISNLLAAILLVAWLVDEWSGIVRRNEYGLALIVFGGGIALCCLNFAYIKMNRAEPPRWMGKAGEAWKVFRS